MASPASLLFPHAILNLLWISGCLPVIFTLFAFTCCKGKLFRKRRQATVFECESIPSAPITVYENLNVGATKKDHSTKATKLVAKKPQKDNQESKRSSQDDDEDKTAKEPSVKTTSESKSDESATLSDDETSEKTSSSSPPSNREQNDGKTNNPSFPNQSSSSTTSENRAVSTTITRKDFKSPLQLNEAEINEVTARMVARSMENLDDRDDWQRFHTDEQLKMWRREAMLTGDVFNDELRAKHCVQGVTAAEMLHYFFETDYKMEWDKTIESVALLARPDPNTLVLQQVHKRVWPLAQRESLFWSHRRQLQAGRRAVVCNASLPLLGVPVRQPDNVRVQFVAAMLCETVLPADKPVARLTRSDVACNVFYTCQVNPGGWVPLFAVRAVFQREYPKFMNNFTQFVINRTKDQPLKLDAHDLDESKK